MKHKLYSKQKQVQKTDMTRAVTIAALTSSGTGLILAFFIFLNVGGIKDVLAGTDMTYYSRTSGDWNDKNTWSSTGHDGEKAHSIPGENDIVYIKGADVRVKRNEKCRSIFITGSSSITTFTIGAKKTLEVSGDINIDMNGDSKSLAVLVDQEGALKVAGNFNVKGEGTSWTYLWFDSSNSEISGDINLNAEEQAGIMYYTFGNATTQVAGNLNLQQNGAGAIVSFKQDHTSEVAIAGDIKFSASEEGKAALLLNDQSVLTLNGNIHRMAAPANFGLFSATENATLVLAGSDKQLLSASAGAGTDGIYYNNVKINNSSASVPQVVLEGTVFIKGKFSFKRGIVETTQKNQITFGPAGNFEKRNSASYIMGPGEETENPEGNPLPVDLLTYDVKPLNSNVVVAWATASELNNDYFTLERSSDGHTFSHLTTVKGAGTSQQTKKYAFLDKSPLPGTSYYQLRQTGFDGAIEAFPVKWVNRGNTNINAEPLALKEIGPNPFVSQFSLSYRAGNTSPVNLTLLDLNGRLLHTKIINSNRGVNAYTYLEGGSLESGIYFLVLEQNGAKVTKRLIKRS
ncbi:MAG: T9SS type A sorting domain-containing protein [Bacteroidia bacterium]